MILHNKCMFPPPLFPWGKDDTYQINMLELPSEDASPNDDRFGS